VHACFAVRRRFRIDWYDLNSIQTSSIFFKSLCVSEETAPIDRYSVDDDLKLLPFCYYFFPPVFGVRRIFGSVFIRRYVRRKLLMKLLTPTVGRRQGVMSRNETPWRAVLPLFDFSGGETPPPGPEFVSSAGAVLSVTSPFDPPPSPETFVGNRVSRFQLRGRVKRVWLLRETRPVSLSLSLPFSWTLYRGG